MLVLARKKGESIIIGDGIEITVLGSEGETVKLGIRAPKQVEIYRKEVYESILRSNREALQSRTNLARLTQMVKKSRNPNT